MIDFGAFVDTYYAYDFNHPHWKRDFTTQPVRHDSPALNMAHLEMKIQTERLRSRVALQAGDSVERNAVTEPGRSKYIQEAYVGYQVGQDTWIDGGIYFGHIGMESWISKNNYTYSRSLILDYVPYYSAGLRLEHKIDSNSSVQFHLMQGWQNISETNSSKAFGVQLKKGSFTYNNFLGKEQVVSDHDRFRHYHNFIFEKVINENLKFIGSIDLGFQEQADNSGQDVWAGSSFILRQNFNLTHGMGFRLEYYLDPHQSNIVTGSPNGFEVVSASANYDHKFNKYLIWRNEVRSYYSKDKIYQNHLWSGCLVTSVGVTF